MESNLFRGRPGRYPQMHTQYRQTEYKSSLFPPSAPYYYHLSRCLVDRSGGVLPKPMKICLCSCPYLARLYGVALQGMCSSDAKLNVMHLVFSHPSA